MPGTAAAEEGVWGGWLSKKPFQKELVMHRLTFDPGQRRVLLLVVNKIGFEHDKKFFNYKILIVKVQIPTIARNGTESILI